MGEVYCKGCRWFNRMDGSVPPRCFYEDGRVIGEETIEYEKDYYSPASKKSMKIIGKTRDCHKVNKNNDCPNWKSKGFWD